MESISITQVLEAVENIDCLIYDESQDEAIVSHPKTLEKADKESIIWIKEGRADTGQTLNENPAVLVICGKSECKPIDGKCVIGTDNPKYVFSHIVNTFFVPKYKWGIHPTAFVEPEAEVHPDCHIGPFSYIGKSKIGKGSVILGQCFIHDNVELGEDCMIHSGCVLGDHGSGYAKSPDGSFFKFPHIGSLILENNVEVGANTYINKGALGETRIQRGSKIGNSVCIGHNVSIGRDTIVIANSVIAGSCTIGDNTWIAPSCTVRNGLNIGNNVMVGMGSVVTSHVEDGEIVVGNPAENIRNYKDWRAIKKKLIANNPLLKHFDKPVLDKPV